MKAATYKRLTPIILGMLIVLLLAGSWYHFSVWQVKQNQHLEIGLIQLDTAYRASVKMFSLATATYFDELINHPNIHQLLEIALHGNGREVDLARGRLYRTLYPSFKRLSQRNLRHLHFVLPDNTSFLRFHRPEEYGDNLARQRPSIPLVNRLLEPIHGFEIGRTESAFRNLYPLFNNDRHLGSVDFSVPFKALHTELSQLMPNMELQYILDKDAVTRTLDDRYHQYYTEAQLHSRFVIEDSGINLPGRLPPPSDVASNINSQLQTDTTFQRRLLGRQSFSFAARSQGEDWAIHLLSLTDIEGKPVGYLISYTPDRVLTALKRDFFLGMLIAWALALVIGMMFILLARSHDTMARLATTDSLTGLPNRRSFMENFIQEHGRYQRYEHPVALLILDIDHFKNINDTFGHAAGDEVLRQFADAISSNLRQMDKAGRLGGEEFAVLLPETDISGACQFADRLRGTATDGNPCHRFETPYGKLTITVSIGATDFRQEDSDPDNILKRADDALYQAKERGRNRVEVFS